LRSCDQRQSANSVSDATVNRDLGVLRHILFWGVDESLLISNPLVRLRLVWERRIKRLVVSVDEESELLAHAPEHLQQIIIAALDTGMRRSEILHQRWLRRNYDGASSEFSSRRNISRLRNAEFNLYLRKQTLKAKLGSICKFLG